MLKTQLKRTIRTRGLVTAAALLVAMTTVLTLHAQTQPLTFTATASVKTASGTVTAPVTITIDRFTAAADRDRLVPLVKANDAAGTRKALAAMDDIGFIQVRDRRTPIKYAYARSVGGGRMITVVSAQPIVHLGGDAPNAKPKAGYDLALALLVLDAADTGTGELAPAVSLKVNESGAIETKDYGSEVVRLAGVKKQ
jgi:hypothetical protein